MKYEVNHELAKPGWPRLGVGNATRDPFIQFREDDMWYCLIDGRTEGSAYIKPLPIGSFVTLTQE